MRWDELLRDLEAQMQGAEDDDWRAEVAERTRGERASVGIAARLAAARGTHVRVALRDGSRVAGTIEGSGTDWMLLADGPRRHLIPVASVATVDGLRDRADHLSAVERRLSMAGSLRALSRDRARVVIRCGIDVTGVIAAVGADHLDLSRDDGGTAAIPLGAILEVVSA